MCIHWWLMFLSSAGDWYLCIQLVTNTSYILNRAPWKLRSSHFYKGLYFLLWCTIWIIVLMITTLRTGTLDSCGGIFASIWWIVEYFRFWAVFQLVTYYLMVQLFRWYLFIQLVTIFVHLSATKVFSSSLNCELIF